MFFSKILKSKIILVLFAGFICFSIGFNWGLPDAAIPETVEPWGIDTLAPIQPLNEAFYKFTRAGNEWVYYPLFHYLVLDVFYAPYVAYQYLTGNMKKPSAEFPYGLSDPDRFCQELTLISRFVSLIMALGIILFIYHITRELFCDKAAFWAALMTALAAPLSYYAKASNPDVPYLFWSFLAFWLFTKIIKTQKLKYYLFFALSAALAVATKDQAYGFFVLVPFIILYLLVKYTKKGKVDFRDIWGAIFSKKILLSILTGIISYSVANNLFFGGATGFLHRLQRYQELYQSAWALNPHIHTISGQLSLLAKSINLTTQTIGYGAFILGLLGIISCIYTRKWIALTILVFPIAYYIFCIVESGFVEVRAMIGPAILLTPFAGHFIVTMFEKSKPIKILFLLIFIASLGWQLLLTANLNLTLINDSRYQTASWIKKHIPRGASIESFTKLRYLPRITGEYNISVIGHTGGFFMNSDAFNEKALKSRDPQYILIQEGQGITGDPERFEDPVIIEYYKNLISGRMGYEIIAKFETPHFIPFRQIHGTRPTCILLEKKSVF